MPVADQLKYFYDAWGSERTYNHMAVAWSWAFDTPFKWTKQVASHFGGTRQGMAIAWPNRIKDAGGIRNQFHHVVDIVPTILEATGILAPEQVDGITQTPIEGVSLAYTFDKANADARAVEGENLSKADIAASQATLQVKKAEAYELGETRKVRAEAAVLEAEHLARDDEGRADLRHELLRLREHVDPAIGARVHTVPPAVARAFDEF